MACEPNSLANLYQDQEEVAKRFSRLVYKVVNDVNFNRDSFKQHDLHLCEAYCLLWQNAVTGEVDGRLFGIQLKIGAFAALFIDLCAENLIELYMHENDDEPHFRLIDQNINKVISVFLKISIFDALRNAKMHGKLRETVLWKWLIRAVDADCVELAFESLVARGILDEQPSGVFGIFKRFPTINPEPELKLEKLIQNIAFGFVFPDNYMLALLVLARESDRIFLCKDPILSKHFSFKEYESAKKNLDKIISLHIKFDS
ncbi:uncharacterized protein LOC136072123 isoform X1 [Hydra vulgaris]|uniref:Uncharacterized protein LOC136072123 isoform X1 n=1 Tax=Hydra vulgaris TaxID=6087 RepID=A0ABM4DPT9_HYDVU